MATGERPQIVHVSGTVWDAYSRTSNVVHKVDIAIPFCQCTGYATGRNKAMKLLTDAGMSADEARKQVTYECAHIAEAKRLAQLRGLPLSTVEEYEDKIKRLRREQDEIVGLYTKKDT